MSTHDYNLANATGAAFRADLNLALAAIASNNSNATDPATTFAFQWYVDTADNKIKIRNAANDGYIEVGDVTAANLGLAKLASPSFTGNVGIGTSAITPLDVVVSGDNVVSRFSNGTRGLEIAATSTGGALQTYNANQSIDIKTYSTLNSHIALSTNNTERMRIDSSGDVLVGATSARAVEYLPGNVGTPKLQVEGNAGFSSQILITDTRTDGRNPQLAFAKTRDGSIVQADDILGSIGFFGDDGSDLRTWGGRITCEVDGTPGVDDMPGRLVFFTTADGASSPTERLRIDSSGNVGIGTTAPVGKAYIAGPNASTFGVAADAALNLGAANGAVVNRVVNLNFACVDSATNAVAAVGMKYTSQSGFGKGDLIFGTRSVTTDTAPTERLRIDSSGNLTAYSGSTDGNYFAITGKHSPGNDYNRSEVRFGVEQNANGLGFLAFATGNNTATERMRIDSSGRLLVGTTTEGHADADDLTLQASSGYTGITLRSGTTSGGAIYFSDATSGAAEYDGQILYSQNAQKMTFGTASSTQMAIDSSGTVGINNDIVFGNQSASGTGGTGRLVATGGEVFIQGGLAKTSGSSAPIVFTAFGGVNERMRLDSSGNLGIGTTSPVFKFHANETSGPSIAGLFQTNQTESFISFAASGTTATSTVRLGASGDNLIAFVNGGERLRIDSSGNLLIHQSASTTPGTGNVSVGASFEKTSTDGSALHLSRSNGPSLFLNANANTQVARFHASGTEVGSISITGSATAFNTSSDYRLKENVVSLDDGITRLKQLSPKRFNFIASPEKTVDGFIAHEAQAVVPQAVSGTHNEVDDKGNAVMQQIDQSKLVPLLTAALQEAIAKIETLEAKVAALEAG